MTTVQLWFSLTVKVLETQIGSDSSMGPQTSHPGPSVGLFEAFVFTPDSLIGDPLTNLTPEPVLQTNVH